MKIKRFFFLVLVFCSVVSNSYAQDKTPVNKSDVEYTKSFQNHIHLIISDVVFKRVTFDYERLLGEEKKIYLKVPISYAFGDVGGKNAHVGSVRLTTVPEWFVGFGFNLYPKGQGRFRFYFGAEFRVGDSHTWVADSYFDENDMKIYVDKKISFFQTAFIANAGILYEATNQFIVGVSLGLGYGNSYNDKSLVEIVKPQFSMGLRF